MWVARNEGETNGNAHRCVAGSLQQQRRLDQCRSLPTRAHRTDLWQAWVFAGNCSRSANCLAIDWTAERICALEWTWPENHRLSTTSRPKCIKIQKAEAIGDARRKRPRCYHATQHYASQPYTASVPASCRDPTPFALTIDSQQRKSHAEPTPSPFRRTRLRSGL
jgi:hypothetical protein